MPLSNPDTLELRRKSALAAQQTRRGVRPLLRLVRDGLRLVWQVSPWRLAVMLGGELVLAAAAGAGIFVVRDLVSGANGTRIAAAVALGVLALISGQVLNVTNHQTDLLAELVKIRVLDRLTEATSNLRLIDLESSEHYDRVTRVRENSVLQPLAIVRAIVNLVGGVVTLVAAVAVLAVIQPFLIPLIVLGFLPLALLALGGSGAVVEFLSSRTELGRRRDYLVAVLSEKTCAHEIRAYGSARALRGLLAEANASLLDVTQRQARAMLRRRVISESVDAVVLAGWLVCVVVFHHFGLITSGGAAALVVAFPVIILRMMTLAQGVGNLYEAALILGDLHALEGDAYRAAAGSGATGARLAAPPGIVGTGLRFRYPGSTGFALDGVDIEIPPGRAVALVGENGSGKTTLAKVLAGLYEPAEGSVTWGIGRNRHSDAASLRQHATVVFQDFGRYALSLQANIGLGRPEFLPDRDAVSTMAARAGLDDLLGQLPAGIDTTLSTAFKDGVEVSGGEWQRIALARALLRDTMFLVLDEPSASLDARAEYRFFQEVEQLLAERSVLLITHRLRTVQDCDVIYVMDSGRVVERGRHAELLAAGGHYAELWRLQEGLRLGGVVRDEPGTPGQPGAEREAAEG